MIKMDGNMAEVFMKQGDLWSKYGETGPESEALVPVEEVLGDIFRDGEEVIVIIRGEDGQLLQDHVFIGSS